MLLLLFNCPWRFKKILHVCTTNWAKLFPHLSPDIHSHRVIQLNIAHGIWLWICLLRFIRITDDSMWGRASVWPLIGWLAPGWPLIGSCPLRSESQMWLWEAEAGAGGRLMHSNWCFVIPHHRSVSPGSVWCQNPMKIKQSKINLHQNNNSRFK